MSQPLLTVIVPCYNVEKYVDKCISSIVNQTYSNLEILLIDDGSTDSTGKICDSWQERDQRISVIHKQNEGLSYVRKTGIENATGEYLTFVDSDDWIDVNMYADMMSALLSTNSDIAQCEFCFVHEDGRMEHYGKEHQAGNIEVTGRTEGVLLMLEKKIWFPSMCNKIFKKSLFDSIMFSKERGLAEDYISLYLFHRAEQSVYIHNEYYFYFQRKGSICNPLDTASKMKNLRDRFDADFEHYSFVEQYPEYHAVLSSLKYRMIESGITLLRNIIAFPQHFTNEYFKAKAEQLRSVPFTHKDSIRCNLKIELYALKISVKLYRIMRMLYNQVYK